MRRDTIACVADSKAYALLDIDKQLKIPLMSISSLERPTSPGEIGHAQSLSPDTGGSVQRSASSSQTRSQPSAQSHARSSSLGGAIFGNRGRQQDARGPGGEESVFQDASPPEHPSTPQPADAQPAAVNKALPEVPQDTSTVAKPSEATPPLSLLKPHIASPSAEEFLVVTGTSPTEVGIGMFVNLDGDLTRPTISFTQYPKQIVVDGGSADPAAPHHGEPEEDDGYVLASMAAENDVEQYGIEIQRCDAGNDVHPERHWLVPHNSSSEVLGIRSLTGSDETQFDAIINRLSEKRYTPFPGHGEMGTSTASLKSVDSRTASSMERLSKEQELFDRDNDSQSGDSLPDGWEASRTAEGEDFTRRLAKVQTSLVVWSGDKVWWAVRNPLLLQLERALALPGEETNVWPEDINRDAIYGLVAEIRSRDAKSELEFLTFRYLRQKAGVLLLSTLLLGSPSRPFSDREITALEEILVDSHLDPRVVLSLTPDVRNEIIEGRNGIWIYGGVKKAAEMFLRSRAFGSISKSTLGNLESAVLHFLRRFLTAWRKMKGFGSVPDEREVFRTVEAALLLVLLELDRHTLRMAGRGGYSVRGELNELVDKGVDCFERAVDILESHHRLFVLSRLYQSRKMAGEVLSTWKRLIEGERDDGQEFQDGEMRVKDYLSKISNQALVQEYGVWLARRNPKLGVEVFAEDKAKAARFEPTQVVAILREEAPKAVKHYLEHLTFGKGHTEYINELIAYYLDIVIGDLESSETSREAVMAAYAAYRALQAPKPSYHHFLTENSAESDEVWQSRLRLLQLLGGANEYDEESIRDRITSLSGDLLVPETIILAGRDNNHDEALRLLVHRLGDYDSAVSYCLRGGASVFYTPQGTSRRRSNEAPPAVEDQQRLFNIVLREFLSIEDASDRVEQTGALLERFGGWFDVDDVLARIPDTWSVDVVSGFLIGALRRLVRERHECKVASALSGAQNLRVSYELVTSIEEKGPTVDATPAEAA